jgi:hypothetical protein
MRGLGGGVGGRHRSRILSWVRGGLGGRVGGGLGGWVGSGVVGGIASGSIGGCRGRLLGGCLSREQSATLASDARVEGAVGVDQAVLAGGTPGAGHCAAWAQTTGLAVNGTLPTRSVVRSAKTVEATTLFEELPFLVKVRRAPTSAMVAAVTSLAAGVCDFAFKPGRCKSFKDASLIGHAIDSTLAASRCGFLI